MSQVSLNAGLGKSVSVSKRLAPVHSTRKISKKSLLWNDALPNIEVDPETYTVKADECVGCNLCKLLCPVDNCITMEEHRVAPEYLNWIEFQKKGLPLNDH